MVGKKLAYVAFASVLALAGTMFAQGPRVAHSAHPSKQVTPAPDLPAGLRIIFSNLGPSSTDEYNDSSGYDVLGSANTLGFGEQWIALPFTPAANATVTDLAAAIGWEAGTKAVVLGLYADNAGAPGTLLASAESTHIPTFGTCCELVEVKITATPVTAGTQYWIGATADDTHASTFTGVFMSSNSANIAYNPAQEGWFTFSTNFPAAAAAGTIP